MEERKSKGEKSSWPVLTSLCALHSLEPSEMFTELHREHMKQKASLAISLVHDPDIIIFDEPTNGLDVLTAKVVTDFLHDLKGEGKTIIVSTHIFTLIEKLCDRVGIIIDGKMVVCDTLDAVCGDKNLEDRFFDIFAEYSEKRGGVK